VNKGGDNTKKCPQKEIVSMKTTDEVVAMLTSVEEVREWHAVRY